MSHVFIPIAVIAFGLVVQFSVQRVVTRRYSYQCNKCGRTFDLSPMAATLAPHRMGGSKLVKCRQCGSWSWASPVPKDRA
jgi:DNA-directed RNA polymerase subunit RPC12/RpoP